MKSAAGFTLVELLVAISLVTLLTAIAIPQYMAYRTESWNSMARSDLRNGVVAQEAAFLDGNSYVECTFPEDCEVSLPGFQASIESDGSASLDIFLFTPSEWEGYANRRITALSKHTQSPETFRYDSATQGSIQAN